MDRSLTSHTDNEGRADEAEKVKNEQLQKQKEGKGEWHEDIASDSESIVRIPIYPHSSPKVPKPLHTSSSLLQSRITNFYLQQIKADRGDIKADKDTIQALQDETAKLAEQKHK